MKRMTVLILTCLLVFALGVSTAGATDNSRSYEFDLSCDGSHQAAVQVGDVITVKFTLNTDSSNDLYAMQNEIMYNSEYLELVPGSITVNGVFQSGTRNMENGNGKKVLMNYVSTDPDGLNQAASVVVGTFQLKAIADGTTTVSNEDCYATNRTGSDRYAVTTTDLTVVIGDNGGGNDNDDEDNDDDNDEDDDEDDEDDDGGYTATTRFNDVPISHWAYAYVDNMAAQGFINGKQVKLFCPDDPITRAEFVTILARMSGDSLPQGQTAAAKFGDVPVDAYYAPAVAWAINADVTKGTGDTYFSPNQLISRQDIATMIYRYVDYTQTTLANTVPAITFSDQAAIAAYAAEAVAAMQQANIINGYSDGSFHPTGWATRAETAKLLSMVLATR